MLSARAMIYPSIHEGYGIPPLEALALGVPVVVTASTPSLEGLSEAGQLRIDPPTVDAVADAMERFLDDDFAARKTAEIEGFEVPTWKGMAEEVARWVAGEWSEDEGGTWSSGPRASAIAGANRRTAGA
jgi:glycosyltransferase involved in cell wall biosynthesis